MSTHEHTKTRKIIENNRGRRHPQPFRACCSCGYVSSGADRQQADERLAVHLKEAVDG